MTTIFSSEDLASWTRGTWVAVPSQKISGVSIDTRSLRPGDIFFALKGRTFDGHCFVDEAFRKGAVAAVVERKRRVCPRGTEPLLEVDDTVEALRKVAAAHRSRLPALIVGITGSMGKTTVKEMVAQMVGTTLPVVATPGNWNNEIGLPLSLLTMNQDTKVGVFEVATNHPGEIATLCRVLKPQWGVVTNVAPVHIEFFGSEEAIAKEKASLLESLPADGLAVLSDELCFFEVFRRAFDGRLVIVSNHNADADYLCLSIDKSSRIVSIREKASGEQAILPYPQPGMHTAKNMLLATAVARQIGVSWENIEQAMRSFRALPMRWQEICIAGVRFINDAYNANPAAMRSALETFWEEPHPDRKWLVLGGMLELGAWTEAAHEELGRLVAQRDWTGLVVVGPLGRLISRSALNAGMDSGRIHECGTVEEAAQVIRQHVAEGDAVLLKASRGIGLEKVVEHFSGQKQVSNNH
ncbi:MAG: UDP-N-acetylmuramoyl-tripeptide--D-alanyl-D-alanine ligase [Kiritimatiellae bacterium]|nr:UDP-N-acetylmuramoyl-tripeptide--D-alanyl-D-alanine ligase [Kiritimatiellia bacterium]